MHQMSLKLRSAPFDSEKVALKGRERLAKYNTDHTLINVHFIQSAKLNPESQPVNRPAST